MNRPTPKHIAPDLQFPLLDGNQWHLADQNPDNFTLVVLSRLHCPLCKKYYNNCKNCYPNLRKEG